MNKKIAYRLGIALLCATMAIASGCSKTPSWNECTKASCWQGQNAGTRHMNILSPKFSDAVFRDRVKWAKARGCNTLHLFLINKGDGEGSGYTALDPAMLTDAQREKAETAVREKRSWSC